ncbi:MAG: glycosyltransferase [Dehalococcoidia bacterium]
MDRSDTTDVPALDGPVLSIVLMVDRRRHRGARALASLLNQSIVDDLEIILLDFGEGAPPLAGSFDPPVRMVRLRRGLDYGRAKTIGVLAARAPIVAFVEEHCVYAPGWAAAIVAAFGSGVGAVTGEVRSSGPSAGIGGLVALMVAGPWSAPARAGSATVLPGSNTTYRRDLLLAEPASLPLLLANELLVQERLRAAGWSLQVVPAARYVHDYEQGAAAYLRVAFLLHRVHSASRVAIDGWSWRLGWSGLIAPVRLLARWVRTPIALARRRPGAASLVGRHLPVVLLAPMEQRSPGR